MSEFAEHWMLKLPLSAEQIAYIDSCARIRCISRGSLVKRLIKAITDDHMVLSILDDDSKPGVRRPYERPYEGEST